MAQLGRYEILVEIGRGSMGAVFQARDPKIDRVVAIKTISVPGASPEAIEQYGKRFFREAQAAGKLSHPGIVTVYDVDEDQPTRTPFIVMEYVAGHSLDRLAAVSPDGRIPPETALDLLQQVAEALDYAHSHGIVHRDIKPSNIIVTEEGRVKIADFGIARITASDVTLPGQVLGTPSYMSPEQLSCKPVDGRSDLFSLGVIAYWLFSGEKPFIGDSLTTISFQVAFVEPKPLSEVNPSLGGDFQYVTTRALAKEPAKRYQSGRELSLDLQDLRAHRAPRSMTPPEPTVIEAAPATPPSPSVRPAVSEPAGAGPQLSSGKKRPWIVFAVAALVVLALATVLISSRKSAGISGPRANLQLVGQHPFRTADFSIWVDGDLRYHNEIAGTPHGRSRQASYLGTISMIIPMAAGDHRIRVHVQSSENGFDEDSTIEGRFPANSNRTLRANITSRGMDLGWQ